MFKIFNGAVWSNSLIFFNPVIVCNNSFGIDVPLRDKPGGWFAQAETELPQREALSNDTGPFLTFFFRGFSHIFVIHLFYLQATSVSPQLSKFVIFSRFFSLKVP